MVRTAPDFTEMLVDLEVWSSTPQSPAFSAQGKLGRERRAARERLGKSAWTRLKFSTSSVSAGAVLEGHFILTSGLRSPVLQKARVFMHADKTERLGKALAGKDPRERVRRIDYVVGPAVGGLSIRLTKPRCYLGVPAIWGEREAGVPPAALRDRARRACRDRRGHRDRGRRSAPETIDCLRKLGADGRGGLHHRPLGRHACSACR